MNRKILITGAQGMVGSRFVELYAKKDELLTPDMDEFDLLNTTLMEKYIRNEKITDIINFAAYTDVGAAEKEKGDKNGLCWKINVDGVRNLIKATPENVHLIHISTDMVFPGSEKDPGPYEERHSLDDNPDKLTWYGYTKGEGERILTQNVKDLAILRIIYPVRAKYDLKPDYLRKPLKLYDEGNLYPLFYDQQISVSFVDEIYTVLKILLEGRLKGIYHSSSSDTTTPYEIVNYLIEAKYRVKNAVKKTSIYEFLKNTENPVRYPIFGGLKSEYSQKSLGVKYHTWKEIVDELVRQNIHT